MPSIYYRRVDFSLAIPALPVEDANAQQIAPQLLPVEILLREEILRVTDPAERLEDEAVAVRRRRVNVREQLALLDRLHALEREIDYFWMTGSGWRLLRKKQRRTE